MRIYLVIQKEQDAEWNEWEIPTNYAFTTDEQARKYIKKQIIPEYYAIKEIELMGE